jgi:hypothetical protein
MLYGNIYNNMPKRKQKKILIFDASYHSHMGYYEKLKQYYSLSYCASMHRFFQLSSMSSFQYDIVIIQPHMYGNGHFEVPDAQIGQAIYRRFFENQKHTKVIVWAHTREAALEHWGQNVKRREVIPMKSHFDFLLVVHGIMTKK